jgi:hypothetical protein
MTFDEYFKEKYGGIAPYLELVTRAIAEDAWNAATVQPVPDGAGATFARQLIDSGAENYIGEVFDTERGDIEVVARYVHGKTPADKLAELEASQVAQSDAAKLSKQVCANCCGKGRFYKTVMSDFGSGEREETVCKVCIGSGVIYAASAAKMV